MTCIALTASTAVFSGEPQRLTNTGRLKFSPTFWNNGRDVIFVELISPALYRLQRLSISTGEITPLHPDATTTEFEPAVAADGQSYAYLKTLGALSIGIVIRDGQSKVIGEIAPEPGFFGYRSPTIAPGSTRVAFCAGQGGAEQIISARLNGSDRKTLTDTKGLNMWPSFSPDGQFIVFGSSREGTYDIYVMREDGTDLKRLTDHPLQDIRPRYSPDARTIVFTSHRDLNAEIYTMTSEGTNLRRISNHPERDDYADWHPDGKHLITVSERNGRHDLYLWGLTE